MSVFPNGEQMRLREPRMLRVERLSALAAPGIKACASALLTLLEFVMTLPAHALEVLCVPEQTLIAPVWLDVINRVC